MTLLVCQLFIRALETEVNLNLCYLSLYINWFLNNSNMWVLISYDQLPKDHELWKLDEDDEQLFKKKQNKFSMI